MAREDLERFKNEHSSFVDKINKLRKVNPMGKRFINQLKIGTSCVP
jgi:hypothetical protein